MFLSSTREMAGGRGGSRSVSGRLIRLRGTHLLGDGQSRPRPARPRHLGVDSIRQGGAASGAGRTPIDQYRSDGVHVCSLLLGRSAGQHPGRHDIVCHRALPGNPSTSSSSSSAILIPSSLAPADGRTPQTPLHRSRASEVK